MLSSNTHTTINHNLFRGTSSIFIVGFLGWALFKTLPLFNSVNISATGDYAPISSNIILQLTHPEKELRGMNSIWTFNVRNKEQNELSNIVLELPFSGYYKLETKNGEPISGEFNEKIKIGSLSPLNEASITTWTSSKISPDDDQARTRIIHDNNAIDISFPIKVGGFWAWLIRSKHFISLFLLIFAIRFLL